MASFTLIQAKIRDDLLVIRHLAEPFTVDWKDLLAKLAPKTDPNAAIKLRGIRAGTYVGISKSARTGKLVNFLVRPPDSSDRIDWLLKRDPSFDKRLIEVYYVEKAVWDASIQESTK